MMNARTTLVEQKRIQWAKEREEMARLGGNWGTLKRNDTIRTTVRTYATGSKDKQILSQPFRATGHYGSNVNLKALSTDCTGKVTTNLKNFDYSSGSLINLNDHTEISRIRRRSPSLPPIYNKDQQQYLCQERHDFDGEGSRYHQSHKPQKQPQQQHRSNDRHENPNEPSHHYGSLGEEREGETSGYASDSIDVPLPDSRRLIPGCKGSEMDTMERTWQNPYYTTPDNSLPPSRRLSDGRAAELINRPRWGSVWGQDSVRGDPPPPPSWLSRLDQSSQVLVINHDSASSPDSSTTGSTGSDTTKTYLRGQNIPVDANILQEREVRRQKALELQNAIKQQLEEKDRQRKEEKARRLREEQLEEERIKRERDKEKERFEEEQRKLKEKEEAKLKKAEAMREILQAAENSAKEEKKNRRKRIEIEETMLNPSSEGYEFKTKQYPVKNCTDNKSQEHLENYCNESQISKDTKQISEKKINHEKEKIVHLVEKSKDTMEEINSLQVPISKDVAIVLSGRLEDSELLKKANLQLVNLVVTPSPRKSENESALSLGLDVLMKNLGSPILAKSSTKISPTITENRLLTPSKYRMTSGRDFGTQTDIESDLQDLREKIQESSTKDGSIKERKDTTNANRRDVEKSTNVSQAEELPTKTFARSKSQPRPSIESRPRWNANRPGTRYRTQSEKDPHYQRRLRLRKRQVESSDEGSRSPSPDRRKPINTKIKMRNSIRRKLKVDSYDADLSMDSLNSVVPLRIDRNGKINIEINPNNRNHKRLLDTNHMNEIEGKPENKQSNIWCGREILEKLNSLRNGLLMKQIEWDPNRSLVSPTASEIF